MANNIAPQLKFANVVQQVKITCKKETFNIIESIDKKQRNKLSKLVDRYIFTIETILQESVSSDKVEQWEIDHPNIIGKNVAKNIKNCVKHNYTCYLCNIDPNNNPGEKRLIFCSGKAIRNGGYEIGAQFGGSLQVDSNNKVTFKY